MSSARRLASVLVAVATAVPVSACGAGLDAQTYQERDAADATDVDLGDLAIRNITVLAPRRGEVLEAGRDAVLSLTVVNRSREADRLVEVSTDVAREVEILENGGDVVVPGRTSTGAVAVRLRDLTRDVRTGEFIEVTLRFAESGEDRVLVPVATTGRADRPVYTGERFEGGEEPALQGPAGGHHGEDEAGEDH